MNQKIKVYKQKLDVASVFKILGEEKSSSSNSSSENLRTARKKYQNLDKESLIDCLSHLQISINTERKAHSNKISNFEEYRDNAVKHEHSLRIARSDNKILNKELEKYMNLCDKLKRENKGLSSVGSVLLEPTNDSIKNICSSPNKKRKFNVISDSSQDEEEEVFPPKIPFSSPISTPVRPSKNSNPRIEFLSGKALFASQVQDSSTPVSRRIEAVSEPIKSPVKNFSNKLLNLKKPEQQNVNYHNTSKNKFQNSKFSTNKNSAAKRFTFTKSTNGRSRSAFDIKARPSIRQNENKPVLEKITDERQILAQLPEITAKKKKSFFKS